MAITKYMANKLIDLVTARSDVNNGTTYLALSTTTPNTDGSGVTEPTGNNYARVLIGKLRESGTWKMTEAENGASHNGSQISFPNATGPWGTCTHACLFDAEEGGNLLWFGELTSPVSPVADEVAIVAPNNISISIS